MKYKSFQPGEIWLDTDGKPIQAHGGSIFYENGTYYWFGENKDGDTIYDPVSYPWHHVDVIGISCYSSQDLLNWKNEGLVLSGVPSDPKHDLHPTKTCERPKVIRSPKTGQYVLFTHVDVADYTKAKIGIAVSSQLTGPYEYIGSITPNGNDSRDMTVFSDDDGTTYLFYSSEWNKTMHINSFEDDGIHLTEMDVRAFVDQSREAPAVFNHDGKYYLISSGCTGWEPNQAQIAVADSPFGPWENLGNPCTGPDAELTFYSQSTFVLPVAGKPGAFIAMFDRWNQHDLRDSRYIWLPVLFEGSNVIIPWKDSWDISIFQ